MSDHAEHHPFQAHHFDDMDQQFDAGKLGIWLFLATEVLFFSGMFTAYTIYRVVHPEVFVEAHHYLDKWLGAFNTIVLLASSLSVAWGVRSAQLDNRKGLVGCLVFTLACAGLFMGVKAVEYTLKFHEGIFWASKFSPPPAGSHPDLTDAYNMLSWMSIGLAVIGLAFMAFGFLSGLGRQMRGWVLFSLGATIAAAALGIVSARTIQIFSLPAQAHADDKHDAHSGDRHSTGSHGDHDDHAGEAADPHTEPAEAGNEESPSEGTEDEEPKSRATAENPYADDDPVMPGADPVDSGKIDVAVPTSVSKRYQGIFFSIYFAMTGIHALHILGGIGVIVWITGRAAMGQFNYSYFGPVEYTGLYWHLVDLIWIFLFPLLYLIH